MNTRTNLSLSLTLMGVLGGAPAGAAVIEHSTAGVLQTDHFENDTVGNAPSQWINTNTPVVQDFASKAVNANAGTKFVELNAGDDIKDSFTAVSTGTLTTSFAFYWVGTTGATDPSRFRVHWLESGLTQVAGQIGFDRGTGTVEGTSLTFNTNEWTVVTLSVNLDGPETDAITVTVNGNTDTANLLNTNGIAGIRWASRISGGPDIFIDGVVPEPASAALLGLGLVTLLRRRRS